MKLIFLHDVNSPDKEVVFDAEDFSAVSPYTQGSAIKLKDSDLLLFVHENPTEVREQVMRTCS